MYAVIVNLYIDSAILGTDLEIHIRTAWALFMIGFCALLLGLLRWPLIITHLFVNYALALASIIFQNNWDLHGKLKTFFN